MRVFDMRKENTQRDERITSEETGNNNIKQEIKLLLDNGTQKQIYINTSLEEN